MLPPGFQHQTTAHQNVNATPRYALISKDIAFRDAIITDSIILQCTLLARRLMFCDPGRRASARALLDIRLSIRNSKLGRPEPSEVESVLEDCLNAVKSFEQHSTNVAMTRDIDCCAQVGDGKSTTIWIRSDVSEHPGIWLIESGHSSSDQCPTSTRGT
jgi:hypothetical protein